MITEKIKRWWQGHGFGIESRTDFSFLHDVLKEKTPYYAYNDWKKQFTDASEYDTKVARLILRVSNSIQPKTAHVYGRFPPVVKAAISSGCHSTGIELHASPYFRFQSLNIRTRMEQGTAVELLPHNMNETNECVAIIVTHIDSHNSALWQEFVNAPVISYDMRDTGIAIMRKGRYPEHYCI